MKSHPENLAVITSGGGMSCAYSGGAVCALAEEFGVREPELAIASSGSAGTISYFGAGQYAEIEDVWTRALGQIEFIKLSRVGKIMDIDKLVNTLFRRLIPLDVQRLIASRVRVLLAATNYDTGEPCYFSNRDEEANERYFDYLRASQAVPVIYNRVVEVNGGRFIDGDLTRKIPEHIQEAVSRGARRIIAVQNSNNARWVPAMIRLYSHTVPSVLGSKIRKRLKKTKNGLEHNGVVQSEIPIVHISPSRPLPTATLSQNPDTLREAFDIGYEDALASEALRRVLEQ